VRNTRYTLVSEAGNGPKAAGKTPKWQLFDVIADPGQKTDIASEKPEIASQLSKVYDQWWTSLHGQVSLNENAFGPKLNPFAEKYWKQFGGGPTAEDYQRMDPAKALTFEAGREKKH
jgi:arylsulfatase